MEEVYKESSNKLLSMAGMKDAFKTIKVFNISNPTEQEAFEKVYNEKSSVVTILRDHFDNIGEYKLAVEIRSMEQPTKSNEDDDGEDE
jgi:hypothetical protein